MSLCLFIVAFVEVCYTQSLIVMFSAFRVYFACPFSSFNACSLLCLLVDHFHSLCDCVIPFTFCCLLFFDVTLFVLFSLAFV